jgi:uncharacterized hydrophobic protein (TIGR00341 family)
MKKVIIEVPEERSAKIREKFGDVLYSETVHEQAVRFTLYIPDDMLDNLILHTNRSFKKPARPLWTGLIPDYDSLATEDDRITLIEVTTPDFVISPFVDRIKEQYSLTGRSSRTPIEKIIAETESRTTFDRTTFILAAIAGLVALIGLFLNNVGIIIGAMLLSPLLGPIYALAVYVAIGDIRTTVRCVEVLGLMVLMLAGIAALAAFALSFVIPLTLTPEIAARQDPNDIYILMALLLGFATMTALSKGIPEGIAGVAIAAALLPPAVVTGLSVVLFPAGAAKAAVLTLQNIVGLIAGSILGAVILQIGPRDLLSLGFSRQLIKRILWFLGILIAFLIIVSFLV